MKKNKILTIVGLIVIFTLVFGFVGCDKEKDKKDELCSYLNSENLDKTIPIINNYLAGQKSKLDDEEKLEALIKWLKSCPCVVDATILCVSCIYTFPAMSEISISFEENEKKVELILDILMSNPLKASICSINHGDIKTCNVDNPLTDLPWLKEFINRLEQDVEAGFSHNARIYQCAYRDGVGFLLDICVGCPDAGYWLRNCEGESLCVMYGYAGDKCVEFNVDLENKILIWEINH